MDKIINKQIFLPKHFINVTTFIDIFVRDEFAINIPERTEEEFLEMMANGYTKNIQQCIEAYEKSPLPERFLKSQAFIVTNALPRAVYGIYAIDGDIYLDADAMYGLYRFSKQFLFGHELGHKIMSYRDVETCYNIIGRVYDTSEKIFQMEVLSDIFGSIVSGRNEIYRYPMEEEVQSQLKLEALKSVYRV